MQSFVYGSRVIENEQQITLKRSAQKIGNKIQSVVKAFVAFFLFVGLNALLGNLVQHTNLFSANAYVTTMRFVEEATRILLIDNFFTTSSFVCQLAISIVSAVVFAGVVEYDLVLRALGNANERGEDEKDDYSKHEEHSQTANGYNVVSYRQKVCFLS